LFNDLFDDRGGSSFNHTFILDRSLKKSRPF
jgi:hypothetical protein